MLPLALWKNPEPTHADVDVQEMPVS